MAKRPQQVMPFKVTLLEIEPPIWKDSGTQHVLILRPARGNPGRDGLVGLRDGHLHPFSLRARGRKGGRPVVTEERVMAQALLADKGLTARQICDRLGIAKNTLYK